MNRPIQIDPPGCGCTECILGEYVPLDEATDEEIVLMLMGYISNGTGVDRKEFEVITKYEVRRPT